MSATDREARIHMKRCPEHEMTVNADDEWECVTCNRAEDWSNWAWNAHGALLPAPVAIRLAMTGVDPT